MKDGLKNSRICAYDVKFAKYRKKLLNHDIRRNTMLLSRKTFVKLNENESNIIGHLCYAASKLWNVCATTREFITKNWDLGSILTGIIRSHITKIIYGSNHYHHRLPRKCANFWISHGSRFMFCREQRE